MKTVTLILPLEATTVNNPINSSGVEARAIAGVTAGALIDHDGAADSATIAQCYNTRLIGFHLDCFLQIQTHL